MTGSNLDMARTYGEGAAAETGLATVLAPW